MSAGNQRTSVTQPEPAHQGTGRGHRWMMIICCIPMIAIALLLVASGVVSAGFLIFAVVCTLLMAFMMGGMGHEGQEHNR